MLRGFLVFVIAHSMSESAASGSPSAPAPRHAAPASGPRGRAALDTAPPFFQENDVSVSATRIVAYGTPAVLTGATSVRLVVDRRHVRFAIPILIAGIAFGVYATLYGNAPASVMAVMLVVVSYLTYRFQNLRHRLFLSRDTGTEEDVFASGDLAFTERVKVAIEHAIAHRAQTPTVAPTPTQE